MNKADANGHTFKDFFGGLFGGSKTNAANSTGEPKQDGGQVQSNTPSKGHNGGPPLEEIENGNKQKAGKSGIGAALGRIVGRAAGVIGVFFSSTGPASAPGFPEIRGFSFEKLSSSGQKTDPADEKGRLTYAGRAIAKHNPMSRPESAFPSAKGNVDQKNLIGQTTLDNILTDPFSKVSQGNNRFGGFDVYSSNGLGARFDSDWAI